MPRVAPGLGTTTGCPLRAGIPFFTYRGVRGCGVIINVWSWPGDASLQVRSQ